MIITSLFDRRQFEVELLYEWSNFLVAEILQFQFIGLDDGQLIVVYIDYFLCIFNDWRCIRSQEMFSLANANHQWAALSCGDDGVWMITIEQNDDISAHNSFQCDPQCFFQFALIIFLNVLNEIQKHFSIRIAFEWITFLGQFSF